MCLKLTETAYLKAQVVQEHNCDRVKKLFERKHAVEKNGQPMQARVGEKTGNKVKKLRYF